MSASRKNFFSAHWDWLAAVAGLAALGVSGAFFALSLGASPEAEVAEYEASLASRKPANEGVAAADLGVLDQALHQAKTPAQLKKVDGRKANFLASEGRVFCQQGDAASKAPACGRPIPTTAEECPYCHAKQTVVKGEDADADHDGMPNEWERKYGLNPNDPSDAAKDKDGDAFTNLEEYTAKTDPTDKASHPDYADSLKVAAPLRKTSLPFYFSNYQKTKGYIFTFNGLDTSKGKATCHCPEGAEIILDSGRGAKVPTGWKVVGFEKKSELRDKPGMKGVKLPVDVSIVTLKRTKNGNTKTMNIVLGVRENLVEEETELTYTRGKNEQKFTVSKGSEIELSGTKYRVEKLRAVENGCEVVVSDVQSKKEKTVR